MKIHLRVFVLLACWLLPGGPVSATLSTSFDGTLNGWTNFQTSASGSGPSSFVSGDPVAALPLPDPLSGSGMIFPIPFDNFGPSRDLSHQTLIFRSPVFYLTGGPITANRVGGTGGLASIDGIPYSALPAGSSNMGFMGLALRNENTDTVMLSATRITNAEDPYETITFSAPDLAALDRSAPYTLDLIDAYDGSWGWIGMDEVSISGSLTPIPEPASVALGFGMAVTGYLVFRRRRASRSSGKTCNPSPGS